MKSKLKVTLKTVRTILIRNLPLKLLSLVFAVLLSSFVIYSNQTITSGRDFSGIEITISGQSTLTSRSLALSTNIGDPVRVHVEVPRSSLANVTAEMIRVDLDLSSIRQTGKQTVNLRGSSSTGRVTQITPESVDVVIEELDSRYVPVNIELIGKDKNYWYNPVTTKTNPTQIVLSGPASIVQQVASALVTCDVTNMTSYFGRTESYTLCDSALNEIDPSDAEMLAKSTRSVTISVEVYPAKQLSITGNVSEFLTGDLPEGYEVESVVVQPESITVAGEQALLDEMHELAIESVDITDQKSSFSEIRKISMLDNFKYKSSDQVTVTVNIREKSITERFSDIPVTFIGKPKDKAVDASATRIEIRASGSYSDVRALKKGDLIASIDLTSRENGTYSLPVQVVADNYPELSFTTDPEFIEVTISDP